MNIKDRAGEFLAAMLGGFAGRIAFAALILLAGREQVKQLNAFEKQQLRDIAKEMGVNREGFSWRRR